MKFAVGYQPREDWIEAILGRAASVSEVYFAFGSTPSGRRGVADTARQLDDLARIADAGIGLDILYNANCYGARAQSRAFFYEVGETIDRFADGALRAVTTTSPLVAKFVKANFPSLSVRASVNMEIGTEEGMEYLAELFDGYYLKRELNRDLTAVAKAKAWCADRGKSLHLLANSGCLNFCSSHIFHDNLVAHEAEIAREDNGFQYAGTCWQWLAKAENRARWYDHTNWIAPEDVARYEGLCDGMKLATRASTNPARILESYATGSHLGDIRELLEPNHANLFVQSGGVA